MSKKKTKKNSSESIETVVIRKSPGFSSQFKEDLAWWFARDFPKASKILDLVAAAIEDPFIGIGKPEPLKYLAADLWSQRLDLEHRLVYRVGDAQIDFLSCRYHYEKI